MPDAENDVPCDRCGRTWRGQHAQWCKDRADTAAENGLWPALVRQRKTMRLRQADVAAALGVGQQIVSRWESGHTEATLTTVARYAEVVGARVRFEVVVAEGVIPPGTGGTDAGHDR